MYFCSFSSFGDTPAVAILWTVSYNPKSAKGTITEVNRITIIFMLQSSRIGKEVSKYTKLVKMVSRLDKFTYLLRY